MQLTGSLVAAGGLLSCGMQTLSCGMHVGSSSLTRDRTQTPALGAQSLNHGTTREVPEVPLKTRLCIRELADPSNSCHGFQVPRNASCKASLSKGKAATYFIVSPITEEFQEKGRERGQEIQCPSVPEKLFKNTSCRGFPGGSVVKNLPANVGDTGSSPGPGRSHMPQSN